MKKLKVLVKHLRFGAVEVVKGVIPWGSSAVKIVEHISKKDLGTGESLSKSTDWASVVIRTAGLAVLLYLVVNDYVPVEELVKFIKSLI